MWELKTRKGSVYLSHITEFWIPVCCLPFLKKPVGTFGYDSKVNTTRTHIREGEITKSDKIILVPFYLVTSLLVYDDMSVPSERRT